MDNRMRNSSKMTSSFTSRLESAAKCEPFIFICCLLGEILGSKRLLNYLQEHVDWRLHCRTTKRCYLPLLVQVYIFQVSSVSLNPVIRYLTQISTGPAKAMATAARTSPNLKKN